MTRVASITNSLLTRAATVSLLGLLALPTALAQPQLVLYGGLGGHGSQQRTAGLHQRWRTGHRQPGRRNHRSHRAPQRRRENRRLGIRFGWRTVRHYAGARGYPPTGNGPEQASDLIRIDPDTGALISSAPITDGPARVGIADLAVHPTTGALYGIGGVGTKSNKSGRLYLINPVSGVATFIGDTQRFLGSIAFAPDGKLYMAGADFELGDRGHHRPILATLDPANAAILTNIATDDFYHSLAVRPTDGAHLRRQRRQGGDL